MKVIVAGPFSIHGAAATAGDILAAEVVCSYLEDALIAYDLATIPPFTGGASLSDVQSCDYDAAIYVCGPFSKEWGGDIFFEKFSGCKTMGVNLSMIDILESWNPFNELLERDSNRTVRPDISLLTSQKLVPIVGVCLVEEYGARHEKRAFELIQLVTQSREMAIVEIDTRLDKQSRPFRSPAEVESVLARMDIVLTTRLHGTVLSLKNGVPVLAIDPSGDECKVKRQADILGWPIAYMADQASEKDVLNAYDFCLTKKARQMAKHCGENGIRALSSYEAEFKQSLFRLLSANPAEQNKLYASMLQSRSLPRINTTIQRALSWDTTYSSPKRSLPLRLRFVELAKRIIS